MTHIITEPCIGVKSADCVDVCPVDCIHEGENMFFIDPEECIDCQQCVPACPVEAIFSEEEVPDEWNKFIEMNVNFFS